MPESKISRFASDELPAAESSSPVRDQSGLSASLYPNAKSEHQIQDDSLAREAAYLASLPRFPYFRIALGGGLLLLALGLLIQLLPSLWSTGSIALIFGSIFVWLVLVGLAFWWVQYTNNTLYTFSASVGLFWSIYSLLMVIAILAYGLGWLPGMSIYGVAIVYAIVLALLSKILIPAVKRS